MHDSEIREENKYMQTDPTCTQALPSAPLPEASEGTEQVEETPLNQRGRTKEGSSLPCRQTELPAILTMELRGGSDSKDCSCMQESGFDPWVGKSPGEGNSNPLPYFCLENPMTEELGRLQSIDRKKSDTTQQLTL